MRVIQLRCRQEGCEQIAQAVILVLTSEETREGDREFIEALPRCNDHAPETAHEVATSMSEEEFLALRLPAFGVGGMV